MRSKLTERGGLQESCRGAPLAESSLSLAQPQQQSSGYQDSSLCTFPPSSSSLYHLAHLFTHTDNKAFIFILFHVLLVILFWVPFDFFSARTLCTYDCTYGVEYTSRYTPVRPLDYSDQTTITLHKYMAYCSFDSLSH